MAEETIDPHLALANAVLLDRTDVVGVLLRRHGVTLGAESLTDSGSAWRNALPNAVGKLHEGDTALHLSCRLGKVDIVRALLRAGVAVNVVNGENQTPLEMGSDHPAVARAFLTELLQHVCSGSLSRVERLLLGGINVNEGDGSPDGGTPLHWAASFGQGMAMIELLVKVGGADINCRNNLGSTPAHEASATGALEALEALYECGADFSLRNNDNRTPRDVARNEKIVAFFDQHPHHHHHHHRREDTIPSTPPTAKTIDHHAEASKKTSSSTGSTTAPSSSSSRTHHSSSTSNVANGTGGGGESIANITELEATVRLLRRKHEEHESLIESFKATLDSVLRDHGVSDHVARLQEHVDALTRQLSATAEQRDKLQNLYVATDRELERTARELAALRGNNPNNNNNNNGSVVNGNNNPTTSAGGGTLASSFGQSMTRSSSAASTSSVGGGGPTPSSSPHGLSVEELLIQNEQLREELERERKEAYAAARLHLTYEADLRAEIKALEQRMLAGYVEQGKIASKAGSGGGSGGGGEEADAEEDPESGTVAGGAGFFSSLFSW